MARDRSPLSRVSRSLKTAARVGVSRPVKIALQVGVLLVIFTTLAGIGFIEYSAQPAFCTNCHLMQPYYDSWASSSHNEVPCIKCHYAPGIKAEAMGKKQAANQVVRYFTGTYSVKPWAEIEDAACLRSGCHVERKLEGVVEYRGVQFDHAHHLGDLRRGKQLRCTSCHSQMVQGDHVAVTEATCYLCHFKGQPPAEPIAGCVGCHSSLTTFTSEAGFVVDHPQYVDDLVSCLSCHTDVTAGAGEAEQARCFNCHNEPERIDEFENTTLLHRVHIADRNVECMQCHVPISHRIVARADVIELDCQACHTGAHSAQQRMYAGVGGHETANTPSEMFLANVSCNGCHELVRDIDGHQGVRAAGEASCLSCHGIRFANVLPSWQREMGRKLDIADATVEGARGVRGSASVRARPVVDSLLQLATENLEFVRVGKSAHNIEYADQLLRASMDLVREAVSVGRLPYAVSDDGLGPPVSDSDCLNCHLGEERSTVSFRGVEFDHESHVIDGAMECSTCHTSLDDHGETTVASLASCDACHHAEIRPLNCAACHPGPGGAPDEALMLESGDFSHPIHRDADIVCSTCHVAPAMNATALDCQSCHVEHHEPETTCLSCHRGGAMDAHSREDHVTCTNCHDPPADQLIRWTPEVCLSCHANLGDHKAEEVEKTCEDCHKIPALGTTPPEDPVEPPAPRPE